MLCDFHEESKPPISMVQDNPMNNLKHVGSLAIWSEPRNMHTCFIVYFKTFSANLGRKRYVNIKFLSK